MERGESAYTDQGQRGSPPFIMRSICFFFMYSIQTYTRFVKNKPTHCSDEISQTDIWVSDRFRDELYTAQVMSSW
jgi:hypothetical protein